MRDAGLRVIVAGAVQGASELAAYGGADVGRQMRNAKEIQTSEVRILGFGGSGLFGVWMFGVSNFPRAQAGRVVRRFSPRRAAA